MKDAVLELVEAREVTRKSRYIRRLYPRWWHHDRHTLAQQVRTLRQVLDQRARPKAGQRIVDIGCGDCPYEPLFRQFGCSYMGCDLDGNPDIRIQPGRPIPLADGCADGVVSFQVLEHVWDLNWYLGECRRLLKPGGWLLLSTHGAWLYHPHPTDFRRWTRDGLILELQDRGFTVEWVEGTVGPLAWTTQFRLLGLYHLLRAIPVLGPLILSPLCILMNLRMILEDAITPASIRESNACIYVTLSRKPSMSGGGLP